MGKCWYNDAIECDSLYKYNEFGRQLSEQVASGVAGCMVVRADRDCNARKDKCPRYLDGMQQLKATRCSYDCTIECDHDYKTKEFNRQLHAMIDSGVYDSISISSVDCGGEPNRCPRYLAVQAKRATVNCPYDDTACVLKKNKLEEFKQRIQNLDENRIYPADVPDDKCPMDQSKCLRYQRYLNVVNKIKLNEKQK